MKALLLASLLPVVAAAQDVVPAPEPPQPPPPRPWIEVPLENTDKPCTVDALDIDATVDGLHARVSTTITIRNPNARPISAPLAFPLPDGAAVCGYALEIDGAMVDGVVVPKEKARVAFETEQRRGVDPGLVEAVKGNVYRTRVYPVPAGGTRRVRVDWTAPLALGPDGDSAALALPMPGVPLARRAVTVEVADASSPEAPELGGFGDRRFERAERFWRVAGTEENVAPRDDLLIALPKLPPSLVSLERTPDGDVWFCASIKPNIPFASSVCFQPGTPKATVLWDATGSRAGDHAAEIEWLRKAGSPGFDNEWRLVVFRNVPEPVRVFGSSAELADALASVAYDGGSDLDAAARTVDDWDGPVFLFTDGMDTLSGKPLAFGGKKKELLAVVTGAENDKESLRQACGGRVYTPNTMPGLGWGSDDDGSLSLLVFEKMEVTEKDGSVHVYSATGASLQGLDGSGVADVQGIGQRSSSRFVVLGRLVEPTAEIAFRWNAIGFDDSSKPIPLRASDAKPGSTLATAWAAMRVQQLAPRANDNADELLALGRRFGVASPATSLLVLESLDQWLRHDIEPPESLPQMREQWLLAKKNRPGEDPEAKAARHLEMLKGQWKNRMDWWNTDWSKVKPPVEEKARGRDTGVARRLADTDGLPAPEEDYDDEADEAWEAEEDDGAVALAAPAPAPRGLAIAGGSGSTGDPWQEAAPAAAREAGSVRGASAPRASSISVKAWSPDTPYLKALDAAEDPHAAYLAQRAEWAASPAFYLDCAGWFFSKNDHAFGVRVLSNLAELRIEDPALLRVMAWRLKQAKAYAPAIATLRRVCKLRPEDAQSWRDLALALDEAGRAEAAEGEAHAESAESAEEEAHAEFAESAEGEAHAEFAESAEEEAHAEFAESAEGAESPDGRAPSRPERGSGAAKAPALLAEALDLYRKVALTPWERHPDSVSLFAVEEYNALYAWCTNRADLAGGSGGFAPRSLPEGLQGCPDVDLRIILSWDADETDVDLHVTEPSGEEAYYGHRRTRSGGDVSKDITDGYGPEEYLLRKAPAGGYRIRAHYFASHQQEVFGPATATATIFTDWGRPNQRFQTLSIRLDKAREMIELGTVRIGADGADPSGAEQCIGGSSASSLRKGMTLAEVKAILGEGSEVRGNDTKDIQNWTFPRPGGRTLEAAFKDGALYYAAEVLPGGAKTILVQ